MSPIPLPGSPVRGSESGAPIMALFDLMGRRWAMGVLWTLNKFGDERDGMTFREVQRLCETISPGVLNQRLKELREARLITRGATGYVPTDLGRSLYDHLEPLGAFSKTWAAALAETGSAPG